MGVEPQGRGRPFLARRFGTEAGFRRRVEVAESLGVPPSQLDGREPETETRYVYDRRGRLLRSITRRESRFTEQDTAELLALAVYRDGLCPKCGRPIDVCTAEEGDPKSARFDVDWRVCNATRTLAAWKRAKYTSDNYPDREAHLLGTTIREG